MLRKKVSITKKSLPQNLNKAIERAKVEYKIIQSKVSKEEKVFTITFRVRH